MRYSSDHKARSRERILQFAAAAIRMQGLERVSLADIMAGAELTNGAFYAHFASKDDLITEAITFMFEERYARMLANLDTVDAREVLISFIDRYLSGLHCDHAERGCPMPALAAEVPHMSANARARFSAGVLRVIEGLTILLAHTGAAEPELQANSMLAELTGALCLARTAPDIAGANAVLIASRTALMRRLGLEMRA